MSFKSRLKKLETLPMKPDISMDNMTEISQDQAEKIYNKVVAGPSPPLFAKTRYGTVPFNELPEKELGGIYKEYANRNLEIITEKEI